MSQVGSFRKDIGDGLKSFPSTLKFITKNKMWRYFLIPAFVGFFWFGFVLFLAIKYVDDIVFWLSSFVGYNDWTFWGAEKLEGFFNIFIGIILSVSVALLFFLSFKYVLLIVLSPFLAWISEKTEHIITGTTYDFHWGQFWKDVGRGVLMNFRNMSMEIPITLLLFAFGFVPVIGFAAPVLIFIVSAYFVGFGMIDYFHERKRMGIRESASVIKKQKGLAFAFGAGFNLMMFVPILGTMIAPLYTIIATTKTVVEREQRFKKLEE